MRHRRRDRIAVFLIEPFAFAKNLQTSAVDEKRQRLSAIEPFRQDCQTTATAAQSGMIRDVDIDPKHVDDRAQQTLSLTVRLVKHQAKRKAGLDGDLRVYRLAAPLSGGRRMPCRHGPLW